MRWFPRGNHHLRKAIADAKVSAGGRLLPDANWLAANRQAALFSVLHSSAVIFSSHFAMGLVFGWLRMRTGSLIASMILHAAWNAANILLERTG